MPKELKIKFSQNYTKLRLPFFSMMRKFELSKWKYYSGNVGEKFQVYVAETPWFKATLFDCYIRNKADLNQKFIDFDTDGKWNLPNGDLVVLLFHKVEIENGEKG